MPGYQQAAVWPAAPLGRSADVLVRRSARARAGSAGGSGSRSAPARRRAARRRRTRAPAVGPRARARRDGDQRLRVRVLRALEHVRGGAQLDDAPEVHHRDAVAERPGQPDVVGDQEQRQAARAAQAEQQVQHLRAHGDVERRDGLVAHEPGRLGRERAGDRDALALAARQLVRVAVPEALRGREPGVLERTRGAQHAVAARHALHAQRLLHELAHAHARVERLVRILEDHLHLPAQRCACRRGRARRPRSAARRRSAARARAACARASSCRSRTRRRRRAPRSGATRGRRRRARARPRAAPAELHLEAARLGQRRDGGGERGDAHRTRSDRAAPA